MNKKMQRAATLLSLLTVIVAFLIGPIKVLAANVTDDKVADYVSTWNLHLFDNLHWTDDSVHMKKVDGVTAFCIEHGVDLYGGSGYSPSELSIAQKNELSLIAYYGYQKNPTSLNYAVTQAAIWETLGDKMLTTTIPDYGAKKADILAKVKKHNTKPSFNGQTITLNVGDSITLTDSNGVLANYAKQASNTANLKVEKNGNSLKLTADTNAKENGELSFNIAESSDVGQSFVYTKGKEQKIVTFKLSDAGTFKVNVNVNLNGHVQVKKVDEDTGKPVPNTTLKFEYNGTSNEVVTDEQGLATLKDIKAGTKVKITEVTAADGYVNSGEIKEVTIEPNKTIEVLLNNKPQQGQLTLLKTGKKVTTIQKQSSEYGDLHDFVFDYQPLEGVTYEIQAVEDIVVGSTTHAKAGEVVATVTTGSDGQLVEMPLLYLGKYQATEKSAPNGFIVDATPLPFEFTYQGQEVPLVSTSLEQKNDFQSLRVLVHKEEETIRDWKDNSPVLEIAKGEGKVFGLYTNQEFLFTDGEALPKDALLQYGEVKEGVLTFENLQVQEGKYYVKELNAGDVHDLDETHHEFEFTAEDNETVKEVNVYGDVESSTPILNKLHFNAFRFKKVNEVAILKDKQGYDFAYTGNAKGAVFELTDEKEKVLQTIEVNQDSIGTVENLPVGTFCLKEKQTSSEAYKLSEDTMKIVSTLDGVTVYDSEGKLLGEQKVSAEEETKKETPPILFEWKNDLIKGSAELSKTDVSTGEVLPNTGIQILDETGNVIVEGRTDENGQFTFENLPKGKYSFKEFDAPEGYELDETPVPFEIKEDGEIVKCEMTNKKIPEKEVPSKPSTPSKPTSSLPQTGESSQWFLTILGVFFLATGTAIYFKKKHVRKGESK